MSLTLVTNLCTPAKIYALLSIFITLVNLFMKPNVIIFLVQIVFFTLMVWLMKTMCERGHTLIPWVLAVIAIIGTILTVIFDALILGTLGVLEKVEKKKEARQREREELYRNDGYDHEEQ